MTKPNTTLDDIAAVIGFTATLRVAAWYGNGNNLFVPAVVEDGQVLVKLIGRHAAELLSAEFGREWLAIPRLTIYDEDVRRHRVACMLTKGFSTREIARHERMSERRVQQLCRELEQVGLIEPVGPQRNTEPAPTKSPIPVLLRAMQPPHGKRQRKKPQDKAPG